MPASSILWKFKSVPERYWEEALKKKALEDEKYVINYLKKNKNIKVVSLGIGPGRELTWLKNIASIKSIIGIDYSQPMLDFCKRVAERFNLNTSLIRDNLLSLKKAKKIVEKERLSLFYICLINTLGNFTDFERIKIINLLRTLIKKKDRLIFCLDKRLEKRVDKIFRLPACVKIKNKDQEKKIKEVLHYSTYYFFWDSILKGQELLPRFWYDDKTNNLTIYSGKKKIFISHRFSKEEIIGMAKKAKFKIEKMIEGKFMWVVILKT